MISGLVRASCKPDCFFAIIHTPENIIAVSEYETGCTQRHQGVRRHHRLPGTSGWKLSTAWHVAVSIDGYRQQINHYIRTSGLFDGVVDFDQATLDPTTGNMKAAYLPNSQFTQLPWDYLHPNHAGYNAMGLAVDITPFAPGHH